MNFDFVVLGATGMQGRIVSRDLLENGYSVLLCGRDKPKVHHLLQHRKAAFKYIEATKPRTISHAIKYSTAPIVVNCMEGDWNYVVFRICAHLGVNCID